LVAASLFTFINLGGAGFALAGGEMLHTAAHVVGLVVGAYFMWRLASQRQRLPAVEQADERFEHLQQSVDAIALEVERIGEAQRYIAKLAAERVESHPPKPRP
jgi:hypothetical protein